MLELTQSVLKNLPKQKSITNVCCPDWADGIIFYLTPRHCEAVFNYFL